MPNETPKTIALLEESLQISIVKASIYEACQKFLKDNSQPLNSQFLVEKINEIPIKTFEHILAAKGSEELYANRMKKVVEMIIKQC